MPSVFRWILFPLLALFGLLAIAAALAGIVLLMAYPQLPSLEALTDYQPKVPLRIFTADGHLIGEFGEERRAVVSIDQVPLVMQQAIVAAEDERFYEHPGVDTLGILRAAYSNFLSGGRRQGASTITMQVARNFFLSSEKTLTRKIYEALLAFKIESNLSKDQILQIYLNQIYLGQRAYGFAAASRIYYGKQLKDITLAEAAMLAGLPKAPSSYNPVVNPKRAKLRQQYVLRRMRELGFINDKQWAEADAEVLQIKREVNEFAVKAEYVAEMARQMVFERFGEDSYRKGLRVITTITKADQEAAYAALRRGVLDYDRRHGYRGAVRYVDLSQPGSDEDERLEEALHEVPDSDDLVAAIVLEAGTKKVRAYRRGGEVIEITGEGLKFARRMLDAKAPPNKRLRRGAIIHVQKSVDAWHIAQLPEVEAAFVAADPRDGSIRALVGGFDFFRNKYNHVTQAWRQPGSSFKPFIYSAALEKGYSPASIVPDEPLIVSAEETGSQAWEPKNYDGKYEGPMSVRTALSKSKNLVSIRLLKSMGTQYAQDYITRFGFEPAKHPPYLTMALGAGSVTPWQMLTGYAVFANGGYRIEPYIVRQVLDDRGRVLAQAAPVKAGEESLRVIDARNAFLMDSMMRDVVRRGTARRALALKRSDLAGKTGTTNDFMDAWFCGYQPELVAVAWIGFDQPKKLGNGETGGSAALPIWIGYMDKALEGVTQNPVDPPAGLVPVTISDFSGHSTTEYIYEESLPPVPAFPQEAPAGAASPGLGFGPAPGAARPPAAAPPGPELPGGVPLITGSH